jgi:hypothetical protein
MTHYPVVTRWPIFFVIAVGIAETPAQAQQIQAHVAGDVGGLLGGWTGALYGVSGGFEVRPTARFGLAAAADLLAAGEDPAGLIAVDVVGHGQRHEQLHRVSPYVASGYARIAGSHAWHVRAGIDYWRSARDAARIETQFTSTVGRSRGQVVVARVGLVFR